MYAIKGGSYRAISSEAELESGEECVTAIPSALEQVFEVEKVRRRRDMALRDTDWTQMADAPLTVAQKTAMGVYRQALRDLPALPGFPDVAWPALPTLGGAASGVETVLIP